jgi:hypothetical protein
MSLNRAPHLVREDAVNALDGRRARQTITFLAEQKTMSFSQRILNSQELWVATTPESSRAMRAHAWPFAIEALSPPDAECLLEPDGLVSGMDHKEIGPAPSVLAPLRTAATGREALLTMLHAVLSGGACAPTGANVSSSEDSCPTVENDSSLRNNREWRAALRSLVSERLEQSVYEGELPEKANVDGLSSLCTLFASGLAASLQDGISATSLATSISLFVESLGFHGVRSPKRRRRYSPSVVRRGLSLVKR